MTKQFWIYILTNKHRTVFYVGVTNNIERRTHEHKMGLQEGFTKQYNVTSLVYYEEFADIRNAIHREKRLKRWNREWKKALIEKVNPEWKDLSADWPDRFW